MQLRIEGRKTEANAGESFAEILRREGLDSADLASRPLAVRISGRVFPLSAVPVRGPRTGALDSMELRRSLQESNGDVQPVRFGSEAGSRVYERTLLFVFLLACRRMFPGIRILIHYAVGAGIYAEKRGDPPLSAQDVRRIRSEMKRIVRSDYRLERKRLDIRDAIAYFENDGQRDKVRLLEWRRFNYFDVYRHGVFADYFYGEMAPSTGYASVFDLMPCGGGIMLIRPDAEDPSRPAGMPRMPKLMATLRESARWGRLMDCGCVADLNEMTESGRLRELVRINEALHEKRYAQIADEIVDRDAKIVLIAGPSSSGKTTSAHRLCTQLRVLGKRPMLLSLDDYYFDRDSLPAEEDGSIDLEHIRCIDTKLFAANMRALLNGEETEIPSFNFLTQRREWKDRRIRLTEDMILVIEGIHGLNPALLEGGADRVYRLYVSALTTLNLDDHNRIPTTQIRLLRRLVRDHEFRGTPVEQTLAMWESVRRGEERWIFPYQETADAMIDTSLTYEPAVLKKHIFPLLSEVDRSSPFYDLAHAIIKFLNYFKEADIEDEIPPTSVLREFIGKNAFYR